MNAGQITMGVVVFVFALTGCAKKAASPAAAKVEPPKPLRVEVVKESERSRHFLAVTRQLELGGTLYGYADIDGDAVKLLGGVRDWLQQMARTQPTLAPYAQHDYAALGAVLGLTGIKAVNPVAGENYRTLRFVQGAPLRVRLSDGRWIESKP